MKKSWMLGGVLLTSAVLGTAVEVKFYDEGSADYPQSIVCHNDGRQSGP